MLQVNQVQQQKKKWHDIRRNVSLELKGLVCVCVFSVSGLGFGLMSGAFSVVNILSDSVGPGTVGIHGDSQHYFISSGEEPVSVCMCVRPWVCVWFSLFGLKHVIFYPLCSLHDSGYNPSAHVLGRGLLRLLWEEEVVVTRSRGVQSPVSVVLGKKHTQKRTRIKI